MDADLQALVTSGKINSKIGDLLSQLRPQTFCLHKSWGFGQVSSWNLLLNQIVIDFQNKKQHAMQLSYAAETLQPLPPSHLFVRKVISADELRRLAREDPAGLIGIALESFGGKVTQDQLQKALAPEIVSEPDFKKWWDAAKKAQRKSGHFSVPARKSDPIAARDKSLSYEEELLLAFKGARRLKDQIGHLEGILKNADNFQESQLQPVVAQVEEIAARNLRLSPAQAFELLIARDELCQRFPQLQRSNLSVAELLREHQNQLNDILPQIANSKHRRVLSEFPAAFPNDWDTRLLTILQNTSFRAVGEIARILVDQGRTDLLYQCLNRTIREHSVSSDVLYWLCKERGAHHFADLFGPELMTAIFSALERDQFSEVRRGSKIHDLLIEDRELVSDLVVDATSSQARDLMRRMMVTPVFEELNKRSLMARMIKTHPELQSMLSGESEEKREAFIVSWASLQRRKAEYDDLVSKRIPENTKEIGIARSYGDLRENFEYKAAKEMQTVLMRRKAELEHMLARARGTNFENVDSSQVSIGTVITLRDRQTDELIVYSVLGAWDSDPDNHVVSYQTAIGQALLGKKPGDCVQLPTETGTREVEIVSVEACRAPMDQSLQTAG
jgi:transcription elongation factor GreA